jgi:predicted nucleic acid-binding protein
VIGYLDSSALVKRYVAEPGTKLVQGFVDDAEIVATAIISRAEVVAAFAKAMRVGALTADEALRCRELADRDWPRVVRLALTEATVDRAVTLAWSDGLRGYDAVQLAAACAWQEAVGQEVSFATFDARLWAAAGRHGLAAFPPDLPSLLDRWRDR